MAKAKQLGANAKAQVCEDLRTAASICEERLDKIRQEEIRSTMDVHRKSVREFRRNTALQGLVAGAAYVLSEGWGLNDPVARDNVIAEIREGQPYVVIGSPCCTV